MSASADEEILFAGPEALVQRMRARELTARELVELSLRRIEALNPSLNAFRTTIPEQALAEADSITDLARPLAGVPVGVKDNTPVGGQVMTRGSRSYGPVQSFDAEIVRKLRAAGAVPIGITNVPELTIFPWTASDANGITRNPWNLTRTPGGSSGGSGAAVAAGMVPAATGSDGGGSIRIPASCCGLVGMKPTRGRVSMQPARQGWLGLSVYGGLARSVRDSALLLEVMQGAAAGDLDVAPPPARSFIEAAGAPPGRLRVAVSRKIPPGVIATLASDQRQAWESTGRLLEQLGHEVVERDPDYGFSAALLFTQTWLRGIYEESLQLPDRSQLERSSRQMASAGRILVPDRRRQKLIEQRHALTARILALWDEIDVLLTPGLAKTAIEARGGYGKSAIAAFDIAARFTPWTPAFNVTGQPAVTVPAGFAGDGLPLSVQLVGRPGAEDLLYSLAGQIEQARGWPQVRPTLQVQNPAPALAAPADGA
ncbi:MAG: amidase [Solirubrobacterales bacterium]|nr:amidase [Solirubrobacterales bacterium]